MIREILDFWEKMEETCVLDMSEKEHTLQEIGETLGVTRERIRQLESSGLRLVTECKALNSS